MAKILTLAAYEQARRALRGVCEPRALRLCRKHCGENPLFPCQNEKKHRFCGASFWQGNRDSNPNIQSQSLLCCRYTIPLCLTHYIVAHIVEFVKGFLNIFCYFQNCFCARKFKAGRKRCFIHNNSLKKA